MGKTFEDEDNVGSSFSFEGGDAGEGSMLAVSEMAAAAAAAATAADGSSCCSGANGYDVSAEESAATAGAPPMRGAGCSEADDEVDDIAQSRSPDGKSQ